MNNFDALFNTGKTLTFKKKEIILSPQRQPKGIYRISSGFLYSYAIGKNSRKRIQTVLQPGEIFPLLTNTIKLPLRFTLEALTDITVQVISTKTFFDAVYGNKKLNKEFIESLSYYLSVYVERLENLEYETLEKRVIARLLYFSTRFGTQKGNTSFIEVPLTHELIAQSINVSRSNVTRELKKLEKEKLIHAKQKHISILDISKLQSMIA